MSYEKRNDDVYKYHELLLPRRSDHADLAAK
jgi:hypothetical protein